MKFTKEEILNEVATLIGGTPAPVRDGGLIDQRKSFSKALEVAEFTFLSNPDAIFYVIQLGVNKLEQTARREARIIEDMLLSLDDLEVHTKRIEQTAELSNAETALLGLEGAGTVNGRAEFDRFYRSTERFIRGIRGNVVKGGRVIRTKGQAQQILESDLSLLKDNHDDLLRRIGVLRFVLEDYMSVDLPTKVSKSVLSKASEQLRIIRRSAELTVDNARLSRLAALKVLSSRAVIRMLDDFQNPTSIKYKSPPSPVPKGSQYFGRATGNGSPAQVITSPGPWILPLGSLEMSVNGGSLQQIDLNTLTGVSLEGRNTGPFSITGVMRNLHVVLDPEVHSSDITSGGHADKFSFNPGKKLGYKHLGAIVKLMDRVGDDSNPRYIDSLGVVSSSATFTWDSSARTVHGAFSTPLTGDFVGLVFKDTASVEYDILEVLGPNTAVIEPRQEVVDDSGACMVLGSDPSTGDTEVHFIPSLDSNTSAGENASVGPTSKTAQIPLGLNTAQDVVNAINSNQTAATSPKAGLGRHVRARLWGDGEPLVSIMHLGRYDPYIQIIGQFLNPTAPPGIEVVGGSSHEVLGFRVGEHDSDVLIRPIELSEFLNRELVGAISSVTSNDVTSGTGSVVGGTSEFIPDNGSLSSVVPGHVLEILDGTFSGQYVVDSVSGSSIVLRGSGFNYSEQGVEYRVISSRVSIRSLNSGLGSSMAIHSDNHALSISSGISHGVMAGFEAVNKRGSRLDFKGVGVGDTLKITNVEDVVVVENHGTVLDIEPGIPANISKSPFTIRGTGNSQYSRLKGSLETFYSSKKLLGKDSMYEGLGFLDSIMSPLLSPGQMFAANINRVRVYLTDLLGMMTNNFARSDEYSARPKHGTNLVDIAKGYSFPPVRAVDDIINGMVEYGYDRAADVLSEGDAWGFFDTNPSTASYAALLSAAGKSVVDSLPTPSRSSAAVDEDMLSDIEYFQDPDALEDFTDSDGED